MAGEHSGKGEQCRAQSWSPPARGPPSTYRTKPSPHGTGASMAGPSCASLLLHLNEGVVDRLDDDVEVQGVVDEVLGGAFL